MVMFKSTNSQRTKASFKLLAPILLIVLLGPNAGGLLAQQGYTTYRGRVMDSESKDRLEAVNLEVKQSNVGTVTNSEGEFILKVSDDENTGIVVVSLLGYQPKEVSLDGLTGKNPVIYLEPKATSLSEVNLVAFGNAEALVRRVFNDKYDNQLNDPVMMTAFYRETIRKRRRNVSLTEAVVNVYKQPYTAVRRDVLELRRARKSTDYRRLDTVALKLQGGPFATVFLDVMKYPEFIFTSETIGEYRYEFKSPSTVNNRTVYVVSFTLDSRPDEPHYYGQLYIDTETLALVSADYKLNVGDKEAAGRMFVKKKPRDIFAYPLSATYKVDYRERDEKWHYGYSRADLTFRVEEKGKWFNTTYTLSSEMAVTDWESNPNNELPKAKDRIRPNVVITDQVSGFSDPDFWGPLNVIEPDKSIESAISKIQRQLRRNGT